MRRNLYDKTHFPKARVDNSEIKKMIKWEYFNQCDIRQTGRDKRLGMHALFGLTGGTRDEQRLMS